MCVLSVVSYWSAASRHRGKGGFLWWPSLFVGRSLEMGG